MTISAEGTISRRSSTTAWESRVRAARRHAGLTQQELADRVGLSRQALNAIETGRSIPNTAVALRLARALGCPVEDLFAESEPDVVDRVHFPLPVPAGAVRLTLARVRGRWVGYPLARGHDVLEGFAAADGLLTSRDRFGQARLLAPHTHLEHTAVLLGCDPSLSIVAAHLARQRSDVRLLWVSAASETALATVAAGEAHVAGSHLWDPAARTFNVAHAERALAGIGGIVVRYASWELGFVVPPGNPKGVRSVADLAGTGVRIVNRELGAGSRTFLDDRLSELGAPPTAVLGYDRVVPSHLEVARAVASGAADAGIALRATADVFGLDFAPLTEAQFDLTIPRDHLDHPAIGILLEVVQSARLRDELRTLPGYEVSQLGKVVAKVPEPSRGSGRW
ncbi:MAG: hypothetical protein KatS3mg060_0786 [Dehalococcoidia bacterium]|nr:MAG: hypothetical protein KatS3mg060_0786 [Dehalococcoidia bacterium]